MEGQSTDYVTANTRSDAFRSFSSNPTGPKEEFEGRRIGPMCRGDTVVICVENKCNVIGGPHNFHDKTVHWAKQLK